MKIESWQGQITFQYDGKTVMGFFPASAEQYKADFIHDKFAHFECDDERTLDYIRIQWSCFHFDNWDDMVSHQWRPTDFGFWMKKFLKEVLGAELISFRDCQFKHERGAVY